MKILSSSTQVNLNLTLEKNTVEVNGYRLVTNIFQNIFFFNSTEERNWENDDRIHFPFKCLDKAWIY